MRTEAHESEVQTHHIPCTSVVPSLYVVRIRGIALHFMMRLPPAGIYMGLLERSMAGRNRVYKSKAHEA